MRVNYRFFKHVLGYARMFIKKLIYFLGVLSLIFIILSFTDYPYYAYHWLGTSNAGIMDQPDYIVVMGAGGMPGPEGMMRCYFASQAAEMFPDALLIIALPADSSSFQDSDHRRMIDEIIRRGIERERILSEIKGTNTITQARNIKDMVKHNNNTVMIITSPEHMYRCIKTFQKQGLSNTGGIATFEHAFDQELLTEKDEKGRARRQTDQLLDLRYNMWSYMQYQITVLREFVAIVWYWLRGYI